MKNAQRLAFATAVLTVVLIGLGTFVRASGAGLGCPDWPTCHGGIVPPSDRLALIESSHRFVAAAVGVMVIATAVAAWRYYRHSPFTVWTAFATVPLVGFQGILGAITVIRELPPEIVATHLVTAMLVLLCQLGVAWSMYREDPSRRAPSAAERERGRQVAILAVAALLWLAVTFWVGGYMAESGAATACEGWPTCNGSLLPANDHQEITHMAHRYLAGGAIFILLPYFVASFRRAQGVWWARPVAAGTLVFYVAQVVVGALNVWYTFPDPLTVAHTAIAACIWFGLSTSAVLGLYRPIAERAGAAPLAGRVPA
jgi:heme A synthase